MDIKKIRNLIELMEEKELVTLEVSSDNESISLTRYYKPAPTLMAASPGMPVTTSVSVPAEEPTGKTENSPMVGVFYSAPSPNDPSFIKVGQSIEAGDTLGIIEAMKIMNPFESTQSGIIEEILVNNGDVIEYGQPVIRFKS